MLAARPSLIPGRKHKTVAVDFANPFLRAYLIHTFLPEHERRLRALARRFAAYAAEAARREAARVRIVALDRPYDAERARVHDEVRAFGTSPRRLAAVFDIDEVLLSNIHLCEDTPSGFYAADHFVGADGAPWPRGSRLNPALPGAVAALGAARTAGLTILYVSGRLESVRDETVENLVAAGFEVAGDPTLSARLLLCPDAEYPAPGTTIRPYKEKRRAEISQTYRIAVNVGDQASDLGRYDDASVWLPQPFYYIP